MNILLLSTGGGGGNILRSVKALFDRDVTVIQRAAPNYAERLRATVTTCFLDTNEFSLSDVPVEERLVIGTRTTGRLGARHNPDVARHALEESRSEVEALMSRHAVVILIGTGGKGTGAGTIFPLAQMARQQKKLVLPIFVRPSFERHEVDKRRYDHALEIGEQFDAAQIRLMEILNDRGYDDVDPKPQMAVWERMNLPIARGLRGLIYVLWDLSQVDPSDLSTLLAGYGRLRIGFGELDPPAGVDPTDEQVEHAVRGCWDNPYCAFSRPAGTSLVCIHGDWSNVVDAKIKGRLAASAVCGAADGPYNPLYTRAVQSPKPWGVTALFGEHTGVHPPLDVDWAFERPDVCLVSVDRDTKDTVQTNGPVAISALPTVVEPAAIDPVGQDRHEPRTPSSLWELAIAVNRSDPAALAVATNGAAAGIPVEGPEVKKLLGTMWFRAVVPRLSQEWRARIFEALVNSVVVPNHAVKVGRHAVSLSELTYAQLQEAVAKSSVPDTVRTDLELLVTVGRLWGGEAIGRFRFADASQHRESSKLASLLHGFLR